MDYSTKFWNHMIREWRLNFYGSWVSSSTKRQLAIVTYHIDKLWTSIHHIKKDEAWWLPRLTPPPMKMLFWLSDDVSRDTPHLIFLISFYKIFFLVGPKIMASLGHYQIFKSQEQEMQTWQSFKLIRMCLMFN